MAVKFTKEQLVKYPHLPKLLSKYTQDAEPTPKMVPKKEPAKKPIKKPKITILKTTQVRMPLVDRMEIAVFWFMLGMTVMSGMVAYMRLI